MTHYHLIFAGGSVQSGWWAVNLAASWAAGNLAQTSAKFLFLPPLKPGCLFSIHPCSCSLLICRLSAHWSLLLSLVCALFPTPFLLEVSEHFSLQRRLGGCPGKKYFTEVSTTPALLLKWTLAHKLETNHTYQQSSHVMAVVKSHQLGF